MSLWLPGYHIGVGTRRPDEFELNTDSSLATGLRFAGLGRFTKSKRYQDSSLYGKNGTLSATMTPATDWVFDAELGRWGYGSGVIQNVHGTIPTLGAMPTWSVGFWSAIASGDDTIQGVFSEGVPNANNTISTRSGNVYVYYDATAFLSWTIAAAGLHYWCVTSSTTDTTLYRDGEPVSSKSNSGALFDWANTTRLCRSWVAAAASNTCRYDITVHDRILSLPEIQTLANRSDPMLGGLIQPIGPRWLPVAVAGAPSGLDPHEQAVAWELGV